MPYVDSDTKDDLDGGCAPQTEGELTYCVFKRCIDLELSSSQFLVGAIKLDVEAYLRAKGDLKYAVCAQVVGALECARREYKRRRPDGYLHADDALSEVLTEFYATTVAPYEDTKIEQNGDVF